MKILYKPKIKKSGKGKKTSPPSEFDYLGRPIDPTVPRGREM